MEDTDTKSPTFWLIKNKHLNSGYIKITYGEGLPVEEAVLALPFFKKEDLTKYAKNNGIYITKEK